jgi:hypothetical protein
MWMAVITSVEGRESIEIVVNTRIFCIREYSAVKQSPPLHKFEEKPESHALACFTDQIPILYIISQGKQNRRLVDCKGCCG